MSKRKRGLDPTAVLAMVGEGYYSANTAGARNVITSALPMVEAALAESPKRIVCASPIMVLLMAAQASRCGPACSPPCATTVTTVRSR